MSFNINATWKFHNPVRLTIGRDCREALVQELFGKAILIVTTKRGRNQLLDDHTLSQLMKDSRVRWVDTVTENPSLIDLQADIEKQKQQPPYDNLLAFGGGSAIDTGKVINFALSDHCRNYSLLMLLENPQLHTKVQPKPLYAVPTTAGTGSEMTPFATIWDHSNRKKLSLASIGMFPYAAYIDSKLSDTVPIAATISTGLDAINQAAESIWNKNANPITIGYATRALHLGFASLPKLARGEVNTTARDQMAEASLLAGLAISHTRTAICHSISYPITAHFGVPHGLACAFTMPSVLRHNLQADDGRFAQLAFALTGKANLNDLVECFDELNSTLQVRERVREYIPNLTSLLNLENQMLDPGRASNNIAEISNLKPILENSWGSLDCSNLSL